MSDEMESQQLPPSTPILNDPLYLRLFSRLLSRRPAPRLTLYCFRVTIHVVCLFLWLVIGGYLLTVLSPLLVTNCPNCSWEIYLHSALLLFGTFAWIRVSRYHNSVWLPSLITTLVGFIWCYDRHFRRVKYFNLTNDELAHFNSFQQKMAAVGTCLVTLKLTLGLLHVAALLAILVAVAHFIAWIVETINKLAKEF